MFNLKNLLRSALMAAVLAGSTGAALATPYHVTIDTTGISGAGFLDLTFVGNTGAAAATATIEHFSGAIGGVDFQQGAISGALPGKTTFSNSNSFNELTQMLTFGSVFSFDLDFGGAFASMIGDGTLFGIGLFNSDQSAYVGANGNLLEFALNPKTSAGGPAGNVTLASFGELATATQAAAVPEPADWLLMVTGLVFVVYMTRLNARSKSRRIG